MYSLSRFALPSDHVFLQPPKVMSQKGLVRHVVPPVSVSQNERNQAACSSAGVAWLAATMYCTVLYCTVLLYCTALYCTLGSQPLR